MEAVNREYITFKHPSTCKISGPSGCGKTDLTRDIIKNFRKTFHFKDVTPEIFKVVWAYGVEGAVDYAQYDSVDIKYIEGMPPDEDFEGCHLLVLDDLMDELADNKRVGALFTKGRHKGVSTFFIAQNALPQGKQMRNVGLNCHYTILFNNPGDTSQIKSLGARTYPEGKSFFMDAFKDATKKPYGYIRLDNTPSTPQKYRLQTEIVPKNGELRPICYVPKNV